MGYGVQVVGLGWTVWLVVIVFVLLAGVIGKLPLHCLLMLDGSEVYMLHVTYVIS